MRSRPRGGPLTLRHDPPPHGGANLGSPRGHSRPWSVCVHADVAVSPAVTPPSAESPGQVVCSDHSWKLRLASCGFFHVNSASAGEPCEHSRA